MKYFVRVGDEEHEVVLDGDGVHVDGEDVAAHVDADRRHAGSHGHDRRRGPSRRRAPRRERADCYTLWLDGYRFDVEALDERTRAIRELSRHDARGPPVRRRSSRRCPGSSFASTRKSGDAVQAGQGLVVMEAMKMENELRAPAAGRVKCDPRRAGHGGREGRAAHRARVNVTPSRRMDMRCSIVGLMLVVYGVRSAAAQAAQAPPATDIFLAPLSISRRTVVR